MAVATTMLSSSLLSGQGGIRRLLQTPMFSFPPLTAIKVRAHQKKDKEEQPKACQPTSSHLREGRQQVDAEVSSWWEEGGGKAGLNSHKPLLSLSLSHHPPPTHCLHKPIERKPDNCKECKMSYSNFFFFVITSHILVFQPCALIISLFFFFFLRPGGIIHTSCDNP